MDLKTLCINKLVEEIKVLPSSIKEELIDISIKKIREDERKKIIEELILSSSIIIEDITKDIIDSHESGKIWSRKECYKDVPDDIYNWCQNISQNFLDKYPYLLDFANERFLYTTENDEYHISDYY